MSAGFVVSAAFAVSFGAYETASSYDDGGAPRTERPRRRTPPTAARAYLARSKSMALYARSFESRWSESICRMVPDLERITSEDVEAFSAR